MSSLYYFTPGHPQQSILLSTIFFMHGFHYCLEKRHNKLLVNNWFRSMLYTLAFQLCSSSPHSVFLVWSLIMWNVIPQSHLYWCPHIPHSFFTFVPLDILFQLPGMHSPFLQLSQILHFLKGPVKHSPFRTLPNKPVKNYTKITLKFLIHVI